MSACGTTTLPIASAQRGIMIGVFARHVHLSRRQDQTLLCLLTFLLIATVDLSECCGAPTEISDPSISCCHPEKTCIDLNNLPSTRWRQSTTPRQPCRETVCVLTYPSQEMLTICRVQREATAWECSENDRLLLKMRFPLRLVYPGGLLQVCVDIRMRVLWAIWTSLFRCHCRRIRKSCPWRTLP